jgi:hypothetical protein
VLRRLPSGTWWTFEKDLKERGLNTVANYYLAQSVLWPDVKIASIRDHEGNVTHHRYEARMFGVGLHQAQTALLIVAGLAFDENFANEVDFLLRKQGLCIADSSSCIDRLSKSYDAAQNHNGKFFDIMYGNARMSDFAKEFGEILDKSYTCATYRAALEPALHICRTGWPDARVNRALFPKLEDAKAFMQRYDESIFENPNTCAHMLFGDKLANAA